MESKSKKLTTKQIFEVHMPGLKSPIWLLRFCALLFPTCEGAPVGFIKPTLTIVLVRFVDPDIWSSGGAAGLSTCQRGRVRPPFTLDE